MEGGRIKRPGIGWIQLSVADLCTGSDSSAPMLLWWCPFVIVSGVHGTDPEED